MIILRLKDWFSDLTTRASEKKLYVALVLTFFCLSPKIVARWPLPGGGTGGRARFLSTSGGDPDAPSIAQVTGSQPVFESGGIHGS